MRWWRLITLGFVIGSGLAKLHQVRLSRRAAALEHAPMRALPPAVIAVPELPHEHRRTHRWRVLVAVVAVAAVAAATGFVIVHARTSGTKSTASASNPTTTAASTPATTVASTPTTTAASTPATTGRTSTSASTSTSPLLPARTFSWPAQPGSTAYLVQVFRNGRRVFQARPTEPHFLLPAKLRVTPGRYRWIVITLSGARAGRPVVDSTFVVAP